MIKIEEHLGLAYKTASEFHKRNGIRTFDEINSAALLGLVQAVNRFDENKGVKFSTFAVPTIVGAIKNDFYRDKSRFIRKTIDRKQVIEKISIDSLNRIIPLKKDVEFVEWCSDNFDMDKELEKINLRIALNHLNDLQKKVIKLIYFEDKSQSEVAKILKTSQPNISRINRGALEVLRKILTPENEEKNSVRSTRHEKN